MKKDYFLGFSEEGFHKIAYTEWGISQNQRSPIVCVHGLTRNGRDFDSLADYLEHHGSHVFCPDIVGRGDSSWLKDPLHYTYEQYLLDMARMITRTNAYEVDWIGTSMGGLLGMVLASMNNSPIRRLVLNDVGPQIPTKGMARLSKYVGTDPTFTSIADAKKYFKSIYTDFGIIDETDWDNFTIHSIRQNAQGQYVSKLDQGIKVVPAKSKLAWQAILHPLKALEGTLFDVNLWEYWRKVACPVLVIRGKNSDILLPETITKMKQIHPQTDVIEIANAGHAPALLNHEHHAMIYEWLMK